MLRAYIIDNAKYDSIDLIYLMSPITFPLISTYSSKLINDIIKCP